MNIVFFIRAYNDIDFMAPIAYKLFATGTADTLYFVNMDLAQRYDEDFRIRFLKSLGRVVMIDMLDYVGQPWTDWFERYLGPSCLSFKPLSVLFNRLILSKKLDAQQAALKTFDFDSLPLKRGEPTIFLFDYNRWMITRKAWDYAGKRGFPVVLIPHGLRAIEASGLLREWKEAGVLEHQDEFEAADYLFSNNENFIQTFPKVSREKFVHVGASRFAAEWSVILDEITPKHDFPDPGDGILRVCIMPSKFKSGVWKEASIRIFKYLASRDDVYTIIKPHTRGMDLRAAVAGANNIMLADPGMDSRRIIEWADVTLFWKSSIFVDALLLDKPLLLVRYASSFRVACEHLVKEWSLDSYLDVIDWIDRLVKDRKTRTYTPEERQACLDFYVDDAKGDVLDRHVDAIVKIGECAGRW